MSSNHKKPMDAVKSTLLADENIQCIDCGEEDVSQKCLLCDGYLCGICIKYDSQFCWNCKNIKCICIFGVILLNHECVSSNFFNDIFHLQDIIHN